MKLSIIQVGDVLLSPDCFEEQFTCPLSECKGACCVEGDAGAPITPEEILRLENIVDRLRSYLTPAAIEVINRQGIAYVDQTGELAVSLAGNKDCVFACHNGDCTICAIERAQREGLIRVPKPISCRLYPLRLKVFANGTIGVNVHHWDICRCAFRHGRTLGIPVYKFLREPLIARFGNEWYEELEEVAKQIADHTD